MQGFEARLSELPEREASGELAVIFGEIRSFARVPFVALIYRHLATLEGVLPWAWAALRPSFAAAALPDAAGALAETTTLRPLAPILPAAWRAAGLKSADHKPIANLLDAYNRANPINLIVARLIAALIRGEAPAIDASARSSIAQAPRARRRPLAPLPLLLPASAIPPEVSAKLAALARYEQPGAGAVTPSLYRHLAHWPGFLAVLPERLAPAFRAGVIDGAVATYRAEADAWVARLLPEARAALERAGLTKRPEAARAVPATLDAFATLIPEMIAVGLLIRGALPSEGS